MLIKEGPPAAYRTHRGRITKYKKVRAHFVYNTRSNSRSWRADLPDALDSTEPTESTESPDSSGSMGSMPYEQLERIFQTTSVTSVMGA